MALYRCGGGGSASTLITKNITQNGTYDAIDDNADGYSSVNVNVSGGGNCTINTQAQWNALTFPQKKAQGLTIIRNSSTEAVGKWFDLTDAGSEYIPCSENIICEAHIDNFDSTSNSWGDGTKPLTLSNTLTANTDGIGVDISAYGQNPDYVYCDMGSVNTDFTVYLVVKYSTYYNAGRLIDSAYSNAEAFIRENSLTQVSGGIWADNAVFGSDHLAGEYIVIALRSNNKTISVFKNGTKGNDKITGTVGQYIAFASSYPYGNSYGANITVAYAGIVSEAESDSTVLSNMSALMTRFNIS